jgi:hypothetical protein
MGYASTSTQLAIGSDYNTWGDYINHSGTYYWQTEYNPWPESLSVILGINDTIQQLGLSEGRRDPANHCASGAGDQSSTVARCNTTVEDASSRSGPQFSPDLSQTRRANGEGVWFRCRAVRDIDYGSQAHSGNDPEVHDWDWSSGRPERLPARAPVPGDIP